MKKITALLLLLFGLSFATEVKPFGFEFYKTKYIDIDDKYGCSDFKIKKYMQACIVSGTYFKKSYAFNVEFWVDMKTRELIMVKAILPYSIFDTVYKALAMKYRLVDKYIPEIGDKHADFKAGDIEIKLYSKHVGETAVVYITPRAKMLMEKEKREEEQERLNDIKSVF